MSSKRLDELIDVIINGAKYFKNFSGEEADKFPDEGTILTPELVKILKKIKLRTLKSFQYPKEKNELRKIKAQFSELKKMIPKRKRTIKTNKTEPTLGDTISKDIDIIEKDIDIIGKAQKEEKIAIQEVKKGRGIRKVKGNGKRKLSGYQLFVKEDMAKDRKTGKASLTKSAKKWKSLTENEKEQYKNKAKNGKQIEKKVEKLKVKAVVKKVTKPKVIKKIVRPKVEKPKVEKPKVKKPEVIKTKVKPEVIKTKVIKKEKRDVSYFNKKKNSFFKYVSNLTDILGEDRYATKYYKLADRLTNMQFGYETAVSHNLKIIKKLKENAEDVLNFINTKKDKIDFETSETSKFVNLLKEILDKK